MGTISRSIRRLRIEKDMTQDQLAEKMNVTRQAVSNWETEKTQPDIDTLNRLAELFETDINDIIYGVPKGAYPRFQERYIRFAVVSFLIAGLMLFIHECGPSYLMKRASDIYWTGREHISLIDYLAIPLLSEALCAIAFGFFTMSVVSLFYNTNIRAGIRKRRLLLVTIPFLLPIVPVVIETILSHVSSTEAKYMYQVCVRHTWLRILLFCICPFIAGILSFLFADRGSVKKGEGE